MFGNHKNHDLQDRAEQIANEAAESLRDLGRGSGERAEDVRKEAAKLLYSAADSIRHEARRAKARKEVRHGADNVARNLERTAHYLKKHDIGDMSEDLTDEVKSNPWRTLAIVFVLGLIIGMIMRGNNEAAAEYRANGQY
jgi:ElaB/YqjD/DUF883 family membrane-anchored ribosome-binding protein